MSAASVLLTQQTLCTWYGKVRKFLCVASGIHSTLLYNIYSSTRVMFVPYIHIIILVLQLCVCVSVRAGGQWKPFDPSYKVFFLFSAELGCYTKQPTDTPITMALAETIVNCFKRTAGKN